METRLTDESIWIYTRPMPSAEPRSVATAAEWLRKHFRSEASGGVSACFELRLAGPRGGEIRGTIEDGVLELDAELSRAPDVRFRLSARDFFGLLAGRENAEMLFMADRVEIEGDLSLAMKIRSLFRAEA